MQSARRSDLSGVRVRVNKKGKATIGSTKAASKIKRRQPQPNAETKPQARRHTKNQVVKNKEILLKRSSGRSEKFDTKRLVQTISRSGIPYLMARDIAKKTTRRIKSEATSKLRKRNPQTSKSRFLRSSTSKRRPLAVVEAGQVRRIITNELRKRNRPELHPRLVDIRQNIQMSRQVQTLMKESQ